MPIWQFFGKAFVYVMRYGDGGNNKRRTPTTTTENNNDIDGDDDHDDWWRQFNMRQWMCAMRPKNLILIHKQWRLGFWGKSK